MNFTWGENKQTQGKTSQRRENLRRDRIEMGRKEENFIRNNSRIINKSYQLLDLLISLEPYDPRPRAFLLLITVSDRSHSTQRLCLLLCFMREWWAARWQAFASFTCLYLLEGWGVWRGNWLDLKKAGAEAFNRTRFLQPFLLLCIFSINRH